MGHKKFTLALLGAAGVCGSLLMYWMTAFAPGVSPDSSAYFATARSLLEGNGFYDGRLPMTQWGPGYPMLLAFFGLFNGGDLIQASRLLGALLFGTNIVLIGVLVLLCTEQSLGALICAILFVFSSVPILSMHAMAWSEAPFITCTLASLILISFHLRRPSLDLLLSAAIAAGLGMIMRYMGVTVLISVSLTLLVLGHRPFAARLKDALLFASLSALPLACWIVRNLLVAANATNREFAFHPPTMDRVYVMTETIYDFLIPLPFFLYRAKAIQVAALGAAALWIALFLYRARARQPVAGRSAAFHVTATCAIFSVVYTVFLIFAMSFLDSGTTPDWRIMMPALLPVGVALVSIAWHASRAAGRAIVWPAVVLVILISVGAKIPAACGTARDFHANSRDFTSRGLQSVDILSALPKLARETKVYTNGADFIFFKTGNEPITLPFNQMRTSKVPRADYDQQMLRLSKEVNDGKAIIVFLNMFAYRDYLPSASEIETKYKLPVFRRYSQGVIYGRIPD